jgi:Chromate transporter
MRVIENPARESGHLREVVAYFLRLGLLGFGGPVALVGQMEQELVAGRAWLSKEQMREAIALCQSLPGPLAIQVGIFLAYLRAGQLGAWAGGWAFILPNFLIVATLGALVSRIICPRAMRPFPRSWPGLLTSARTAASSPSPKRWHSSRPMTIVFVNADNPLSKLTVQQLDGIFGAERTGGMRGAASL